MSKRRAAKMPETIKCRKCGFDNPENMKFCGNCGAKLIAPEATRYTPGLESLAITHLTGSLYLMISLIFNALIKASALLLTLYIASMLLGLYATYAVYKGKRGKQLKITSALAIILGLIPTIMLFVIGLEIRGVIGPAWIIFLVNAWLLWKKRTEI